MKFLLCFVMAFALPTMSRDSSIIRTAMPSLCMQSCLYWSGSW